MREVSGLRLLAAFWATTERIGVNAREAKKPAKQPTAKYPDCLENESFILASVLSFGPVEKSPDCFDKHLWFREQTTVLRLHEFFFLGNHVSAFQLDMLYFPTTGNVIF